MCLQTIFNSELGSQYFFCELKGIESMNHRISAPVNGFNLIIYWGPSVWLVKLGCTCPSVHPSVCRDLFVCLLEWTRHFERNVLETCVTWRFGLKSVHARWRMWPNLSNQWFFLTMNLYGLNWRAEGMWLFVILKANELTMFLSMVQIIF